MQKKFITKSDQETIALGSSIGESLLGGEFIALTGDLGGGKTQFTKGIAKALGITETVVSPTFTIERVYQGKISNQQGQALNGPDQREGRPGLVVNLHHFDLYRTKNDQEIAESIRDLSTDPSAIVVVEWPENIEGVLPEKYMAFDFKYIDENTREITLEKHS